MSKMPAKKKSCFQITSVTQAQVAAIGATDDTESLDDPDESRTEDVSSEIYDMSRAEYEPACDGSSSEEALNNVGEPEAISVMAPSHIPHAGQLSALSSNPVGEFRKVGVSGSVQGGQQPPGIGVTTGLPVVTQPGAKQQQPAPVTSAGPASVSVNTSQPAAVTSSALPPATSTVSCTSRFRVIKLDHGTGEPFRRGRWTCTEFYEKDFEGSVVSRTVDSIRHGSATLDPAADRDSGLGLTGGSVVAPATHSGQGLGSTADASHSSSRMHSVETLPQQQQTHPQNFSARQQGVSGSATQSAFSSSKPTTVPTQPTVGGLQPSAPHSGLPVGQNGLPQSVVHIQKSPIMPPSAQPVAYPPHQQQQQQQLPMGHHLTSQSSGLMQNQTEYYQQQQPASMQSGLSGQPLPVSGMQPVGQGPASVIPIASGGASVPGQVGETSGAGGGSLPTGQAAPGLLQQQTVGMGGGGGSILVGGSTLQQQTASQYAAAGQPQPHGLHPTSSSVQNVPAIAVSVSVPTTVPTAVPSASSAAMPNVTAPSLPTGQIPHSKTQVAVGAQGFPATGFGQVEGGGGGGRKSEGLVNAQSPVVSGKELVKPLMPESLQLTTPAVNSLFGIHIPVDGEEDRNPSKAFYKAFQSGSRLRDSKAHSDSASGTNVVAIDNKIEQAMDLVKSHLMYAVREEVEVLKEQIKELYERNSVLERENAVLKSLANSEQLSQLSTQSAASSSATPPQQGLSQPQQQQQAQPPLQVQPQPQPQLQSHLQLQHHPKPQQLQTQPQLDPGQQQLQPNVTSA
ncbi:TSC22 domain family protein 2 isoform X1 [Lates calcarifer]|uniref:TSC22 domain family protein 2 isoform X1 n=1 Tax=Lates calcarifer TaxID=8187 RepID=A0AAJ7LUW1_LATCA|nr:TSC22 domain family protein 2 isoform X1 [Lates calcarifer]